MAWHVILCSIGYIDVQKKKKKKNKESNKRAPGWVVI